MGREFSSCALGSKKSAIREILKLTQGSDIVSLAGGLPSYDTFPRDILSSLASHSIKSSNCLQYGQTEGLLKLREQFLICKVIPQGVNFSVENIIITSGAQQAIDLLGRIFINRGDVIFTEAPTFLGAINSFESYGADLFGFLIGKNSKLKNEIDPDELEFFYERKMEKGKKIKMFYLIPDFQNPAGTVMSEQTRRKVLEFCIQKNIVLVEDAPYCEIRFEGENMKTFLSLDEEYGGSHVVQLLTVSKTICPGFRIGAVVTKDLQIIDKIVTVKQSADLCTAVLSQAIVADYLEHGLTEGYLKNNLENIVSLYRRKRDIAVAAFEKFSSVSFIKPNGGLFLWVDFHVNASELLKRCIQEAKVAFCPGLDFYPTFSPVPARYEEESARINFSYAREDQLAPSIEKICSIADSMRN